MAQTKRKRHTKHRGNAAGIVESRGRTGRKPTAGESGAKGKATDAKARREERLNRAPTWRGAINRGALAAMIMLAISVLLLRMPPAQAAVLLVPLGVIYVPMGYYTELFLYRRRMRQKAAG